MVESPMRRAEQVADRLSGENSCSVGCCRLWSVKRAMTYFKRVTLLAVLALIQGCASASTSWRQRPLTAGTPPTLSTEHPVRITRTDQSVIVLEHPRMSGDSLVGDLGSQRFAIVLTDIQRLEERQTSVLKTGAKIAGISAVFLVGAMLAALALLVGLLKAAGG